MDAAPGNASSMHNNTHLETQIDKHNHDDLLRLGKGSKIEKETCSSSSSSDTSSEDDFFQLDASEHSKSRTAPTQHGGNAQLASEVIIQKGEAASANSAAKHEVVGNLSEHKSPRAGGSPELPISTPFSPDLSGGSPGSEKFGTTGAKQSPPIQVMGRSDVPDPNRIPSSVFARTNTTTPMEWSMASNESLFSIHVGNSSFSRDHAFLLGKSQELGNFSHNLLDVPPPVPPAAPPTPVNPGPAQGLEKSCATTAAANAEAMNDVVRAAAEGRADKERTSAVGVRAPRSTSTSRLSDGSVCSFAFPILTGEGRDGSIKVGPEHQPAQPQKPMTVTPKAVHGAAGTKWFPCFSCSWSCC